MTLKYKHSVLLVDDEVSITNALKRLFRKEPYQVLTASSGKEGLEALKKAEKPVSLIVSDQRMPEMTGSQFLEKAKEIFPDAMRFLLTGYSDMDAIVDAVNRGEIHRYFTKPWNDDDLLIQVRQSLEQFELTLENRRLLALTKKQNTELNELNKSLEEKVNQRTREIKQKNTELEEVNAKLEKSFMDTIRLLSSLIETLNPGLGKIMRRVAELGRDIAEEYGLDKEEIDQIEMAGMIHDIGLLGLPEKLLAKEEKEMDEKEFRMFSQHPVIASMCLESVEKLSDVAEIILYHHEHYDGTGFPNGLKGAEIPLGSRIITAAADYCRIVDLWPREKQQIIDRARKYIGESAKELGSLEPEKMLAEVAQKVILLGAHQKYDIEVVTRLIRKAGEIGGAEKARKQKGEQVFFIDLADLKQGMVLAKDLRTGDGRLLLVKGTVLKGSTIKSIQNIGDRQLIDDRIYVSV